MEDPAHEIPHPVDHPTRGFFATCRRGLASLANGLAALGRQLSEWFSALRRFMGFGGNDDGATTPPSASFAASEPSSENEDEVSDSGAHDRNLVITPADPDEKRKTPEDQTSDVPLVEDAPLHPDTLLSATHHAPDFETHHDSLSTTSAGSLAAPKRSSAHTYDSANFDTDDHNPNPSAYSETKHPTSEEGIAAEAPRPIQHHASDFEAFNDHTITAPSAPEPFSEHKLGPSELEASSHNLILELFEAKLQIAEEGAGEISFLVRGDYKNFCTAHDDPWYFDLMQTWTSCLNKLLMTLRDTQEHATGPELKNENIRERIDALTNIIAENASLFETQRTSWAFPQSEPSSLWAKSAYYWSQYCDTEQQLLSSLAEEKTQVSQDLLRLWVENMLLYLSYTIYFALFLNKSKTPAHWLAATLCIHVCRCKLNIPWHSHPDDIVEQLIQQVEQPGLRILEALDPHLAALASSDVQGDELLGDKLREACSLFLKKLKPSKTLLFGLSLKWQLRWHHADFQALQELLAPYTDIKRYRHNLNVLQDNCEWRAQHIQALRREKAEEANHHFTAWKTTLQDILATEIESNAYVTSEESSIQSRILDHRESLYHWTDLPSPEREANILQQSEAELALIFAKEDDETHLETLAAT